MGVIYVRVHELDLIHVNFSIENGNAMPQKMRQLSLLEPLIIACIRMHDPNYHRFFGVQYYPHL